MESPTCQPSPVSPQVPSSRRDNLLLSFSEIPDRKGAESSPQGLSFFLPSDIVGWRWGTADLAARFEIKSSPYFEWAGGSQKPMEMLDILPMPHHFQPPWLEEGRYSSSFFSFPDEILYFLIIDHFVPRTKEEPLQRCSPPSHRWCSCCS